MQLQSRGRTKQSTLQAVDVTKEHSAENNSRGNTLTSVATQGLKQSLALHSLHATHLHSLGNQSATFRQIGNFGTIPSGQKTFGESILSHSQLSLSLVLGFSGNIENIAHAAMTRQVHIAHAVMTRSCCIPFTLHKTAV